MFRNFVGALPLQRVVVATCIVAPVLAFAGLQAAEDDTPLFSLVFSDEVTLTIESDVKRVVLDVSGTYLHLAKLEAWIYNNEEVCDHKVWHARGGDVDFQIQCSFGDAASREITVKVDSENIENQNNRFTAYK